MSPVIPRESCARDCNARRYRLAHQRLIAALDAIIENGERLEQMSVDEIVAREAELMTEFHKLSTAYESAHESWVHALRRLAGGPGPGRKGEE